MKILHIDCSPMGERSVSRQLTAKAVAAQVAKHPGAQVEHLDLAIHAPNHLDLTGLAPRLGIAPADLTPAQHAENAITERLLTQFLAADVLVVGAPMYNFSVPTQLKAWCDRIAQAGRTFQYTPTGPKGLVTGKKAIVISTRGGFYAGKPHEVAMDHQEAYMKGFFGFLGITDVQIVRAEGLNTGDEPRQQAIAAAEKALTA
jgi:FMN-dependent NADH-azoreductase